MEVTMSADPKAVARLLIDIFNRGTLDDADGVLASSYSYRGPNGEVHGAAGWKQLAQMYRNAFPDVVMTIDEQIAEGDTVVTRFTARGTHRGELAGVAPSGRFVTVPCIAIDRIADGRIVGSFELFDQLGMFQAIGTLPAIIESA
jgi:predicted ester cyclase